MMKRNEKITGIIECEEGNLTFVEDDYCFTFMSNNYLFHFNGSKPKSESCTLVPKNGFVFGKTHDSHPIAICFDTNTKVDTTRKVFTNSFVLGDSNTKEYSIEKYDSITFVGGTLNSVFYANALQENLDLPPESHKIEYDVINDSIQFSFRYDNEEYKVTIASFIRHGSSNGTGETLKNDEVFLTLVLPKKESVIEVYRHVANLKTVLSIMTFRKNVGFDEIQIENSDDMFNKSHIYIRPEKQNTQKSIHFNICFKQIEGNLSKLFEIIYSDKKNIHSFDFGFIPDDDEDAFWMSREKVKGLASALECEYTYSSLENAENHELDELITEVKNKVKDFRKSHNQLSENTYSLVFGSIKYWSFSFYDRLIQLVNFCNDCSIISKAEHLDKNSISKFVKYRNAITHGRAIPMSREVANTAFELAALVCCCFYKRIGVNVEMINCLIDENFLYRNK